eukprot:10730113-Alexandrium_andersonii.AAC.1
MWRLRPLCSATSRNFARRHACTRHGGPRQPGAPRCAAGPSGRSLGAVPSQERAHSHVRPGCAGHHALRLVVQLAAEPQAARQPHR